jgi:ribosomal-protein-alanine N-acetyltransferase
MTQHCRKALHTRYLTGTGCTYSGGIKVDPIATSRLHLKPYTAELICEAVHNRGQFQAMLGAQVSPEWPGDDYAWCLPFIAQRLIRDPTRGPWDRLIIHQAARTLIGHVGFKGGPNSLGGVDLGYSIVPGYRGLGLATEAGEAMVAWAHGQPGVKLITARCQTANRASRRVLEKVGLQLQGESGLDLLWALDIST